MLLHYASDTPSPVAARDGLAAILDPATNIALHRRPAPARDIGDFGQCDDVTGEYAVATLLPAVTIDLRDAGYGAAAAATLAADIADLAARFARIMEGDRVAIRLEVVETDACRRFHADYVTARLICTYAGPGTQWLDADAADALAAGAAPDTLTIRQLDAGDVAIFKGRLWAPDAPAIHRSPPIEGSGIRRLVLVIDPA